MNDAGAAHGYDGFPPPVHRAEAPRMAEREPVVSIRDVSKTYASGFEALKHVDLDIHRGEIFALLGPNGAGKTTLINIVCGIVTASQGSVTVGGHDIVRDYRAARSMIGLVPQELPNTPFETVWVTVSFSRGLFGKPPNPAHIESVLKDLALWDKKDTKIMALSGGMKRRMLIAKALSHEPQVLFLDEPTAGVDVELRQGMWQVVRRLNADGHTIVLTTHYLEEAELHCSRIAMLKAGRVVALDSTRNLLARFAGSRTSARVVARDGRQIVLKLNNYGELERELARLRESGVEIADLELDRPDLEQVFLRLTS
jgi:ABC-2 type transport system ATP-binding protein